MSDAILEVRDLHTHFFLRRGVVKAVDGVSFSLKRGEVLGLKDTINQMIANIRDPRGYAVWLVPVVSATV